MSDQLFGHGGWGCLCDVMARRKCQRCLSVEHTLMGLPHGTEPAADEAEAYLAEADEAMKLHRAAVRMGCALAGVTPEVFDVEVWPSVRSFLVSQLAMQEVEAAVVDVRRAVARYHAALRAQRVAAGLGFDVGRQVAGEAGASGP